MKAWYMSKTLWVSFIVFGVSALQAAGVNVPDVPVDGTTMGMIIAAIFGILRVVTKKEVTPTK